jgi:hypothetical protein
MWQLIYLKKLSMQTQLGEWQTGEFPGLRRSPIVKMILADGISEHAQEKI